MTGRRWTYSGGRAGQKPSEDERRAIGNACETFIQDVLIPRFLPEIRPTEEFNYPVAIFGKWHGGKYRFIQRFRSDRPENELDPESDSPFARIEFVSRDRFDVSYFRHTGQWWTVYRGVSLAEALSLLETEGVFHPIS